MTETAPAPQPTGIPNGSILAVIFGVLLVVGLGIGYPMFALRGSPGDAPPRDVLEPPAARFLDAMSRGDLAAARADCTVNAAKALEEILAKRPEIWAGTAHIDSIDTQLFMATWLAAAKATLKGRDGKDRKVQLGLVRGPNGWLVSGASVEGEAKPLFPSQQPPARR
ncbi:MAG: hypothetical protein K8T20_08625 [Planctomycetes bacterium]|nr:hypothetical protein [Planctomycetota bacterium]